MIFVNRLVFFRDTPSLDFLIRLSYRWKITTLRKWLQETRLPLEVGSSLMVLSCIRGMLLAGEFETTAGMFFRSCSGTKKNIQKNESIGCGSKLGLIMVAVQSFLSCLTPRVIYLSVYPKLCTQQQTMWIQPMELWKETPGPRTRTRWHYHGSVAVALWVPEKQKKHVWLMISSSKLRQLVGKIVHVNRFYIYRWWMFHCWQEDRKAHQTTFVN